MGEENGEGFFLVSDKEGMRKEFWARGVGVKLPNIHSERPRERPRGLDEDKGTTSIWLYWCLAALNSEPFEA